MAKVKKKIRHPKVDSRRSSQEAIRAESVRLGAVIQLLHGQRRVLEELNRGKPFRVVYESLVEVFEQLIPRFRAAVLILDGKRGKLKLVAHGPFEKPLVQWLGTLDRAEVCAPFTSVFDTGKRYACNDLLLDESWSRYQKLVLSSSVRGCWGFPLFSREKRVVGLIAFFSESPGQPNINEFRLMREAVKLAELVFEKYQREEWLSQSEARFRALAENTREVTVILDRKSRCRYVSPSVRLFTGKSAGEWRDKTLRRLIHPEDQGLLVQAFRSIVDQEVLSPVPLSEFRVRNYNGQWKYFEGRMFNMLYVPGVEGVVIHCHDVTPRKLMEKERENMQAHAFRSAKLASIGVLAAGVAHEVNNPLAIIQGFVEILEDELPPSPKVTNPINAIKESVQRISEIVCGLRNYSRQDQDLSGVVEVVSATRRILSLVEVVFRKEKVSIVAEVPEDPLFIKGAVGQFQQILMNLLSNSKDAVRSKNQGKVMVRIGRDHEWVKVEVRDNGVGIEEAHLAKIFDPFFTTKPQGEGTGLGLGITYALVRSLGGAIEVSSQVNQGSCFTLKFLDLTKQQVSNAAGAMAPSVPSEAVKSSPEMIFAPSDAVLIVEDEEPLRKILVNHLRSFGSEQIVEAANGLEALSALKDRQYRLIVTDLSMPEMDGVEFLSLVLRKLDRGFSKVVILTGGSVGQIGKADQQQVLQSVDALIQKPVTRDQFYSVLSSLLIQRKKSA